MKRISLIIGAVMALSSCSLISNTTWDSAQLSSAMSNAATAASITDAQIVELCKQSTAKLDAQNTIDNGAYNKRLQNLVKTANVDGLDLNFKVYKTDEINAFASADGSVRVYSGLMDVMNDDELIAVIGHEIGHVVKQHVKARMKKAYMNAAARNVVNAAGTLGALSQTALGDIAETLANSQYSQKMEYVADDYGFEFAIANGHTPYSMANSLQKLVTLSGGAKASQLQNMFSDHPDNQKRADRQKEKADRYTAKK